MTDTLMLRDTIKKSGLKYQYLAKILGISRYGLHKKIENESQFKAEEIKIMCYMLKITSLNMREKIFFAEEVDLKSTTQRKIAPAQPETTAAEHNEQEV